MPADQLQGELNRSAGQQAELQRRLGEAELRVELNGKSNQQETSVLRNQFEFSQRKIELLERDKDAQKRDFEQAFNELQSRNLEVR